MQGFTGITNIGPPKTRLFTIKISKNVGLGGPRYIYIYIKIHHLHPLIGTQEKMPGWINTCLDANSDSKNSNDYPTAAMIHGFFPMTQDFRPLLYLNITMMNPCNIPL